MFLGTMFLPTIFDVYFDDFGIKNTSDKIAFGLIYIYLDRNDDDEEDDWYYYYLEPIFGYLRCINYNALFDCCGIVYLGS